MMRTPVTPMSLSGNIDLTVALPFDVRRTSDGAGSPRLLLVREPDQFGLERAYQPLAFGVRLVEFPKPDRHVAAHDERAPTSLDDDDLHAASVAWRRHEPEPGQQFEFAVDRHVLHAGRIDPLANRVVSALRASSSSRRWT